MKIAIIIDSIKLGGGAEKNSVVLANLLAKESIETVLITFNSYENEYKYEGSRISFYEETESNFIKKLTKTFKRFFIIKRLCKEQKITHIVSFLEQANTYTIITKIVLRNKPKLIVSVRNNPAVLSFKRKFLILFLYRFADLVVSVSKSIEIELSNKYCLNNVTTIYNPIDIDQVQSKGKELLSEKYSKLFSEEAHMFVNIGRLHKQKGQANLIRDFAEVCKQVPTAKLLIIGEGSERTCLQQLITSLLMDKNIFLLGQQENIYPFLKHADCYICSSLWEGFPNVLLEAAAMGLYIISTDCSTGPREIIAPDKLGEEIKYPYRVSGSSLVRTVGKRNSLTMYKEIIDVINLNLTKKQAINVRIYNKEVCVNAWQKVLY